ncbi:hypothetical protein LXL04_010753 [Taraxacum kok-saghyz]
MKYEDLKKDPTCNVKRFAEFLGHPFSIEEEKADVVENIIQLCSSDTLSNLEATDGDWENYFTDEMKDKIDKLIDEKMSGTASMPSTIENFNQPKMEMKSPRRSGGGDGDGVTGEWHEKQLNHSIDAIGTTRLPLLCLGLTRTPSYLKPCLLSITTAVNFTIVCHHHRSPQVHNHSPSLFQLRHTTNEILLTFLGCAGFNHSVHSNLTCRNDEKRLRQAKQSYIFFLSMLMEASSLKKFLIPINPSGDNLPN